MVEAHSYMAARSLVKDHRGLRLGLLALVALATACADAPARAEQQVEMTVKVVPPPASGVFRDTALVYLDGVIDAGAPDRLARALEGIDGRTAVWLNSSGGNLFAGMQLGRIIRKRDASTYIINYRTLLPGVCYSACSLAFLGGVYRFNDNGARYGVHRASLSGSPKGSEHDLGADLSTAITIYLREMGVDARLLDLWAKAGSDEMYVLSAKQAGDLGVVNNGRQPPRWSIGAFPGGSLLQGRQTTADGSAMVFFSCDKKQTTFGSVYDAPDRDAPVTRGWSHRLAIDGDEETPLDALAVTSKDGVIRSTFILAPALVRRAMSAKRIGHRMTPAAGPSPSIGGSVDIDEKSAPMVRQFLGACVGGRAK